MSEEKSLELRISVDVGYRRHSVAMGLSSGEVLEEFEIDHRPEGFQEFWQPSVADANKEHSRCYKSPAFPAGFLLVIFYTGTGIEIATAAY